MADDLKTRYVAGLNVEPERFELFAGPVYDFEISRRDLWKTLGAGFLLSYTLQAEANLIPARLHLAKDGKVTLLTGKVDVGQGSRTVLAQVVAEELRLQPAAIAVIMGDTDLVPDDGGTWGSLTCSQTVPVVRKAAAAARSLLLDAAAERLACNAGVLSMEDGVISHPSGTVLTFAELVRESSLFQRTAPSNPIFIEPSEWTVCGITVPALNARNIVTGAHRFSSDLRPAGVLTGQMIRPAAYHAALVSVSNVEGVRVVREGEFIGIIEPDAKAASVRAEWKETPLPPASDLAGIFGKTFVAPAPVPGARYPPLLEKGQTEAVLKNEATVYEARYSVAYIAHVPLEPRAAIAEWKGDRLTVHCGTQAPFLVRRELAEAFHLPEANVRVIAHDTGSGFGGKQRGECEIEAARLAKLAKAPVKLAWTREEEFTRSYARPAGLVKVRSALTSENKIAAWDFRNYNSGAASLGAPYAIGNYYCGFFKTDAPLRQGSYRSLAGVANTFARESHIDELAAAAEMDPVDFRLRNLENLRLKAVIARGAERFRWAQRRSGSGVAVNFEKDGYMALFTEIEGSAVRRMVIAFDCGAILNPGNLENQIQGALIQGLGGALFEQLVWDKRKLTNAKLSKYRVPRFTDVPEIEVLLIDQRKILSAGAGESPITVVAPSIANAIFSATGKRLRSLPLLT